MQAVGKRASVRGFEHVRAESLAHELTLQFVGGFAIRQAQEKIHVVRREWIRTALAQLIDDARIPGIVLLALELEKVLPDPPGGHQPAENREHDEPVKFHPVYSSSAMVTLRPDSAWVISTWHERREFGL